MGPLIMDLKGLTLAPEEREMLQHPAVGGVIFFSRNYQERAQLIELVRDVRASRYQPLLLCVDQEGGRVQRFREHFSRLPPMGELTELARYTGMNAEQLAAELGWLMASEILACGIDISFAPVVDKNGISEVIGNRAFASERSAIVALASAFIDGMHQAGMKSTGKHFPGHGSVRADSHVEIPVDQRSWNEIEDDFRIFQRLIASHKLDAVMPAHVIYPAVDDRPAGFSPIWLHKLRTTLAFNGVIFSDDLSMAGAAQVGDYPERARAALSAGCDMVLACNDSAAVVQLLDQTQRWLPDSPSTRGGELLTSATTSWDVLQSTPRWHSIQSLLS